MGEPVRTLLLWCPDWPVLAAEIVDGVPATGAVAVLHANRVIACSERARAEGVRRGLRRREAQGRCSGLTVVDHDPGRDARAFEPVVAAVEEVAVGVEVIRPGACALAARGPSRYLGGEEAAAERIVEQVALSCAVESQVGVAAGVFAAGLAAREGRIVPPGGTAEFLAGQPVEALGRSALADLLRRLGVRTLGDFAALPAGDVLARFGFDGALAHRLAAGQDDRPLAVRRPPVDLTVTADLDEPIDRIDVAAFAARTLAEQLHERLAGYGLACTRLGIEAVTAHGQELHRVWRHDGLLTAAAIADRVRWQLDGWLSGARRGGDRPARPTAGIIRLRLLPDGVLAQAGLQPGLWGETGAERERAHRALSRVQGLLGPEAVVTAVLGGGRSPADQTRLVPWGDERLPARPGTAFPGTAFPATAGPATAFPGTAGPATAFPGTAGPGAAAFGAAAPGAADAAALDAAALGAAALGAAALGADAPDAAAPGAAAFGVAAPGAAGPGVAGGSAAVRAGGSGSARPGVGFERKPGRGGGQVSSGPAVPPWPGRLPPPSPAVVLPAPLAASVLDATGAPVVVSARLAVSAPLARLSIGTMPPQPAGPTPAPGSAPSAAAPSAAAASAAAPSAAAASAAAASAAAPSATAASATAASATPSSAAALRGGTVAWVEIVGWAGPWPVDERWWAPAEARRRARFQVRLADGTALLLAVESGRWLVEAIYD